jgi:hypothetical protein
MAAASMAAIKPYRVSDQKMTHKLAQIAIGGLDQQMKVLCAVIHYVKSQLKPT